MKKLLILSLLLTTFVAVEVNAKCPYTYDNQGCRVKRGGKDACQRMGGYGKSDLNKDGCVTKEELIKTGNYNPMLDE